MYSPTPFQDKADQIAKYADYIAEQTNDLQVIKAFMHSRLSNVVPLSAEQEKKYKAFQYIYDQLAGGRYTELEIQAQLVSKYDWLNRTSAAQYIIDAKELFSTTINFNKQFDLQLQANNCKRLMIKAEEIGDLKAVANFQKNLVGILKELKDIDTNADKRFQGHTIYLTADPRVLGKELPTKEDVGDLFADIEKETGVKMPDITDLDWEEGEK